jgi:hypothetical protein
MTSVRDVSNDFPRSRVEILSPPLLKKPEIKYYSNIYCHRATD